MPLPYRGFLFDIDGVLEFHGRPYPGAAEALAWLRQKGILVSAEEVITASYATAEYLRQLQPRSCWVMLESAGLSEFAGLPQDEDDPEYIVVGDNRSRFDFDTLNKALRKLMRGTRLIGMTESLIDYSMGDWELNVGAWVQMLERASGVKATYIGKPHPYGFQLGLRSMGLQPSQAVMVGDQLETDVAGAKAVGMTAILVRTGEYTLRPAECEAQPDYTIDSVADLPGLWAA